MSDQQQPISPGEKEEQELEDAEKAFEEENKIIAAQQSGEPTKEETASEISSTSYAITKERNQQILATLGFKSYHDAGVTKYSIRVMNIKIGVTFNETNPLGKVWAYFIPEGDEEKKFFKNGKLAEHPLIQKYHAIQEGKEPMPEISVTGKVIERRGKAIKVEITENGEKREIFYGLGAVKKDKEGKYFIPAGFSKGGKDKERQERDAKMSLPRDIRLPDYEVALKSAPIADITKEKPVLKEKEETQPIEKTTMDEVIKQELTEYTEAILKYTDILAEVTEAISAEDRIPSREKGYAVKFVYYSVIGEMKKTELSETTIEAIAKAVMNTKLPSHEKGGDHEGQA